MIRPSALILALISLGYPLAHAAPPKFEAYLDCFHRLEPQSPLFVAPPISAWVIDRVEVPVHGKGRRAGVLIVTPDACYPHVTDGSAPLELQTPRGFIRYEPPVTDGDEAEARAIEKPTDVSGAVNLAYGDVLPENLALRKIREELRRSIAHQFKRYESEKLLVKNDPRPGYLAALDACEATGDPAVAAAARAERREKFKVADATSGETKKKEAGTSTFPAKVPAN